MLSCWFCLTHISIVRQLVVIIGKAPAARCAGCGFEVINEVDPGVALDFEVAFAEH
jgi:hypothetical protein